MDSTLKQRLIGAAVLAALAIIFLPMLLKGPEVREPDAAAVPLTMPAEPGQEFETRELPLTVPETAPAGGVLGMDPGASRPAPDATAAVATTADAGEVSNPAPTVVPGSAAPATAALPPTGAAPPAAMPNTAPLATANTSASVGAGDYVVNIGSFGNIANAQALVQRLRAAGLPVVADHVTIAAGPALRVRVGPYADRTAAEAGRLRAETVAGSSGKVVVLDAHAPVAVVTTVDNAAATSAAATSAAPTRPTPVAIKPPSALKPPVATPGAAPTSALLAIAPAAPGAGFAVQLSAPSVEAEAIALRDRARGAGFSAFVQRVDTDAGARYRVRVGPFADRAQALVALTAVNGKLGSKGIVVRHP